MRSPFLSSAPRQLACALCLIVVILARIPLHARQGPQFFPVMEGEIWKTQPPDKIGKQPPTPSPCFTPAHWEGLEDTPACPPDVLLDYPEELNFPVGVAVYEPTDYSVSIGSPNERRIFVADRYNNRIVPFVTGAGGTWIPLYFATCAVRDPGGKCTEFSRVTTKEESEYWVADGQPAEGQTAQWHGFPADNEWNLDHPEHIAVDRAGNLWVSDLYHSRIAIFSPTGEGLGSISLSAPAVGPYGIALNDDAEWGNPAQLNGRAAIVAIDESVEFDQDTHIFVVDAITGTTISRTVAPWGTAPGSFKHGTGIAYHRQGSGPLAEDRILVADSNNQRVQVFQTNAGGLASATPEFMFGEGMLHWTYSVFVDNRGRALVSDSGANRLMAFELALTNPAPGDPFTPHANFLFELNADGGLDGQPKGVAEDADGRIYIADSGSHEIEVFEIPELAIVDIVVTPPVAQSNSNVFVEFSVMVPSGRSGGLVTPGCAVAAGVTTIQGPASGNPTGIDGTDDPPVLMESIDINGGHVYRFSCEFATRNKEGAFAVVLTATAGPVQAPEKQAEGIVIKCPPGGCETTNIAPVIGAEILDEGTGPFPYHHDETGQDVEFYRGGTIRLTADDTPAGTSSGIARIYWRWEDGAGPEDGEPCDEPGIVDPEVRCSPAFPTPVNSQSFDVPATEGQPATLGETEAEREIHPRTLQFWARDFSGNFSDPGFLEITVDTTAPVVGQLTIQTPRHGKLIQTPEGESIEFWSNQDVIVTYAFEDNMVPNRAVQRTPTLEAACGEQPPLGPPVVCPAVVVGAGVQGRDLGTTDWRLIDVAQNGAAPDAPIDIRDLLEDSFNIDRGAPTTAATVNGGALAPSYTPGTIIRLTGTDPLHGGIALSGVKHISYILYGEQTDCDEGDTCDVEVRDGEWGSQTLEFWSRDWAENEGGHTTVTFYVNHVPEGVDDEAETPEGTEVDIDVLANDVDHNNDVDADEDPLSIVNLTAPTSGGSVDVVDGKVHYTPPSPDFAGTDVFTYQAADTHGGTSEPVTVTVTVTNANDPPIPANDTATVDEDDATDIEVLANDSDPDEGDTLTISSFTQPAHGVVTVDPSLTTFHYTPAADYSGPDFFTYKVRDDHGAESSNAATVTISVVPVDDPVEAGDDTAVTTEDDTDGIAIDVTGNDSSADGSLTYVSATDPPHGTVSPRTGGSGIYIYTPDPNFHGTDTFTYTVRDPLGPATTATVTIEVTPVNDAPVAVNDTAQTTVDVAVTIPVLSNDSDIDSPRSEWIVTVTMPAGHGTTLVNADGTVTYTPVGGYIGPDSFKYTVTDQGVPVGVSQQATVSITVRPPNDPPGCGGAYAFPSQIWPPNHKQHNVVIRGVTDPNGDAVTIRIDRILQDEPTNTNGDGNTWIDGGGIGTSTAWVRAERMGPENDRRYNNGRVYEIFFTATDAKGDSCPGKVIVSVPHDQGRGNPAIDNGCRWDSTVANGPVLSCAPGSAPPHDDDHDGHRNGDKCDHERGRNGHRNGDGCQHDRRNHDDGRNGHRDGDNCAEDRDHRRR